VGLKYSNLTSTAALVGETTCCKRTMGVFPIACRIDD
jgi:hypothetical protein